MNIIVLMNDTFRRDHLGCYGNDWIATPHLDRFAQRSAVFDQYYIASYPTVPNRWDMLTGRYGFPTRGWQPLAPRDVTLAQILSAHRAHTQMIWDTPMLAAHDYNYTRGFSGVEFVRGQKGDAWITSPDLPTRLPAQPHKIKSPKSLDTYLRNHHARWYEREYCVARTMSAAMDWLECNHSHDPFFLYVDMWDPHEPFDSPWYDYARYAQPGHSGEQITYPQYGRPDYMTGAEHDNVRALYAGIVTLVDRWVGQFLNLAERLGLFENTLIVWTTDHGHLFGEHHLQGKPGAYLGKLYEVTTRIPLIVHHPEGIGAGRRVGGLVQPPDLLPSLLEAMDLPKPSGVEGTSFWPLVRGDSQKIRDLAFSSRFPTTPGGTTDSDGLGATFDGWSGSERIAEPSTVTTDEWAMVCTLAGLPDELYHLPTDPAQEINVIRQHPDVAQTLRDAWIAFLQEHQASDERIRPFVSERTEALMALDQTLYAFRDDHGRWIAWPTKDAARGAAYRADSPGSRHRVTECTFGALLDDDAHNLVHLHDQYYWASDLA